MKSRDLKEALSAFLDQNPDLNIDNVEANPSPEVEESIMAGNIKLNVAIEKKGRNGKTAIIIYGFHDTPVEHIESLAHELKKKLGVGGSCRGEEILIQGNNREGVVAFLRSKGYIVK